MVDVKPYKDGKKEETFMNFKTIMGTNVVKLRVSTIIFSFDDGLKDY